MVADILSAFSTRLFERAFRKELERFVERMFKDIMREEKRFKPATLDDIESHTPRQFSDRINIVFRKWNKYINEKSPAMVKRLQRKLKRYIDGKFNIHGLQFRTIGEDLQQEMNAKAIETMALIKSIPQEVVTRVTPIVMNSLQQGNRAAVRKELRRAYGITRRRAKTIARDQVAKNLEAINTGRARQVGLEYYYWDTQMDERVSKGKGGHKQLNGKIFKWDEPEAVIDAYGNKGHPKDRVNCRCRRRWILPKPGQEFHKIKLGYEIVTTEGDKIDTPKDLGTSKKYQ